ncbi:MAG: PAS domain S-box protein [Acidobacteria bacterium]|nr:MAG: PAS domain S-box protein [Acidobacteriota bacterium]
MSQPSSKNVVPFSVLLVDGDDARRRALAERFSREEIPTIPCGRVREALEVLACHRPNVAVVAPANGGGLALDVAERLRRTTPALQVVVLGAVDVGLDQAGDRSWLHLAPAADPDALLLVLYRLLSESLLEALAAGADRYRTLLDTANSVIVHLTADFRIQDWNAAAEELHGYRRKEVLGRSYIELFLPESHHRRVIAALEEVLAGGSRKGFENPARVRDGSVRTVLWNVIRLDIAEGVPGILAIGQDITARKRLEGALREAQRLQRQITETVPEHIALYDLVARRTIYANHRLARILGYGDEHRSLETRFLPDLLYGDDPQGFATLLERLEQEPVVTSTHELYHRQGASRILLARHVVFARDDRGKVRQVLSMLQDVTESERAATALRESREELRSLAQHLQAVRDEERAGIAREIHDQLGQELTALKIHMSVLKNAARDLDPAIAESLETAAKLVVSTTETVRRISRNLRPHPTAHLGLIPAIRWHIEELERDCGIRCRFVTELKKVNLDLERETHIFRILQEALTNVVRHAQATSVEIELAEKDGILMLTIADDGRGISEDVISTGKSVGMTGMRERAHLCGGELTVFCAPGAGTIIVLRVPMSAEDADPKTGAIYIGSPKRAPGVPPVRAPRAGERNAARTPPKAL